MERTFSNRRFLTAVLAGLLVAGVGLGGFLSARPARAIIAILIGLRQGPIGVPRNHSALIGLLLPAVQASDIGTQRIGVRLFDATSGRQIGAQVMALDPGGPARFMHVEVMGDGSVRFNRTATNFFVRPGQLLQIAVEGTARVPEGTNIQGTLQIHSVAGDGSVVPTDQFSLNYTVIKSDR